MDIAYPHRHFSMMRSCKERRVSDSIESKLLTVIDFVYVDDVDETATRHMNCVLVGRETVKFMSGNKEPWSGGIVERGMKFRK